MIPPLKSKGMVVDIGATLAKITMQGLSADLWPRHTAVNKLATEGAKQRNQGVKLPFVMADLRTFLPLWMASDKELADAEQEEELQERDTGAVGAGLPTIPVFGFLFLYQIQKIV